MALPSTVWGQQVTQSQGVDSRVDYASLVELGPWDDRNYELTADDLALLAPDEARHPDFMPAFFRVELRRWFPDFHWDSFERYPRSAFNRFKNRYGGYLVDGKIYERARRVGERFEVVLEQGVDEQIFPVLKALDGEARVSTPNGAAESAVAINPVNPDIVIAGTNGPVNGQDMFYSTDGGETWTRVASGLPLGGACCDPTVAWSSDGTKGFAATLGNGIYVYRTADGGQTWTDFDTLPGNDPRREISSGFVDKEYIHVDTSPTSPHQDNIYLTWQVGTMFFSRSTDMGNTWSTPLGFSSEPTGIGSDIATDKAGNVYYFYPAPTPQDILVLKSTDGGVTFGSSVVVASTLGSFDFPVPVMPNRRVFIYVAADVDLTDGPYADRIYASWTDATGATTGNPSDNHARIQVGYSSDGGATWTVRTPHETADANTVDRFHQWIKVAPDGSVHVIFYDTRQSLPDRDELDLYHSVSTDGGDTWSAPDRLTTVTQPKPTSTFDWGDYNGLDIAMNRMIAIYTDNRAEGGGGNSQDVYVVGRTLVNPDSIFFDGFEIGSTGNWSGTGN